METQLDINYETETEKAENEVTVSEAPEISATVSIAEFTTENLYYDKLQSIDKSLEFQCYMSIFFMAMLIFISLYKFLRSLF